MSAVCDQPPDTVKSINLGNSWVYVVLISKSTKTNEKSLVWYAFEISIKNDEIITHGDENNKLSRDYFRSIYDN